VRGIFIGFGKAGQKCENYPRCNGHQAFASRRKFAATDATPRFGILEITREYSSAFALRGKFINLVANMPTKRDLTIALIAAAASAALVVLAQPAKPVMGSSVFDWNSIEARTNANGSVRTFFNSPTATLENLECHVTTLMPGKAPHPPHHHPNEEMIILREGTLEVLLNGEWKRIGPGSIYFAASNVEHGVRNAGDTPAVYHVINWRTAATPKAEPEK
jgi:quercetin dioxygenase-like cupin family protein